ncbi:hypothetical protein [Streptomyces sp. CdTB01]|uniref:hypothetical protein n=1 Tax=Streptomyces sp. CdTB01 TaxID=1725411 RepID=UPI00073ACCCA|nr:hypothetical protein [Streptomyces sp. CdTB01]ALV33131.1 hypothetical protein AS200_14570 [Streptomyces sp. CdTB01]
MRTWPLRRWAVAAAVTVLAALVIGVPTGVIPTPFYTRMTPVLWWNYPVWALSSVLEGLLVATYVRPRVTAVPVRVGGSLIPLAGAAWNPASGEVRPQEEPAAERPRTARALLGGLGSAFAVGCPICNKLVVLAIGVSGALSYWAPVQPVLAVASLGLLGYALVRRLRTAEVCVLPS